MPAAAALPEPPLLLPTRHDIYPAISPDHSLRHAAASCTILITGAGSGIGKATAETFAQASAATIVLVGRNAAKLDTVKQDLAAKYPACKVLTESCDVSSEVSVDALFARLEQQTIEVDVLINNAGVAAQYSSIADSDPSSWWRNHEIMLKGPYLLSRAYLRQRRQHSSTSSTRPGAIINTSTIGSHRPEPLMSSYCIPKSALNRLTEYLHAECQVSDPGVHCVAFHPGGVRDTELTAGAPGWLEGKLTETGGLAGGVAVWLGVGGESGRGWLGGRYVDARWDVGALEGVRGRVEEEDLLKGELGGVEGYREPGYGMGK